MLHGLGQNRIYYLHIVQGRISVIFCISCHIITHAGRGCPGLYASKHCIKTVSLVVPMLKSHEYTVPLYVLKYDFGQPKSCIINLVSLWLTRAAHTLLKRLLCNGTVQALCSWPSLVAIPTSSCPQELPPSIFKLSSCRWNHPPS
jgi:hypothetical protein